MVTKIILSTFFAAFFSFFAALAGGGGGGCGPADNCGSASSLSAGTLYSFGNSGCDAIADCEDCFTSSNCANICGCVPCANEDCNSTVMGKICSIEGSFCGSPENTSWGEFCPTQSGDYDFTVSNISCTGGGASLQFGIYAGGVTCGNNNQSNLLDCSGGTTTPLTYTHTLTAGQCYLIFFDGNAGATCTWDFFITPPPLPVKLQAFEAEVDGHEVHLEWQTSEIVEGSDFHFTRRFDNLVRKEGDSPDEEYAKLGVEALDHLPVTSAKAGNYAFTDKSITQAGLYFYELYQSLPSGSNRYLGTIETYVDVQGKDQVLNAYYGPGKDQFTLEFQLTQLGVSTLDLYDINGTKVKTEVLGRMDKGFYRKTISLAGLRQGVYLFNLRHAGVSMPGKIIRL